MHGSLAMNSDFGQWTVLNSNKQKKKKKFIVFSFQQNKLYPKRTLKHKHQLTLFDSPLAYLA